jgi:deazaflavin-dependent oxidoreductase (nitroreductase family)
MTCGIASAAFRQLNRIVDPIVRSGVVSLVPVGPALVVLETVGRRSGEARSVPVLALRFGSRVLIGTVRRNSHWLANVDATPSAAVWLGGSRRSGRATVHHEGFIDAASIEVEPVGEAGST